MNWLDRISPVPRHGGHRLYKQGVINPWRIIYDFELFMFKSGKARFIIDGQELLCPSPYFVIIPPHTKHISYCLSRDVIVYWCHFDWTWLNKRQRDTMISYNIKEKMDLEYQIPDFIPNELLHGTVRTSQVFIIHETMSRLLNSNILMEQRLSRSYYLQELIYLFDDSERIGPVDQESRIANMVRECLNNLAKEPFSIMKPVKIALNELGQSYFHQERIFKKKFKITPYQYLDAIRMEQIKELMKDNTYSISKIADEMGFKDPAYFSRYFSRHCGISPRKYRQQNLC